MEQSPRETLGKREREREMKWFSIARYVEEDAHSRDYLKEKLCVVSGSGMTHRGLRVRRWTDVRASSAKDAKNRVAHGEGIQRS